MSASEQNPMEKAANIKISLKADSGYSAKLEGRISAAQWGKLCAIVHGTDKAPSNAEVKPE